MGFRPYDRVDREHDGSEGGSISGVMQGGQKMEKETDRHIEVPDLPDETDYPPELIRNYELLECFSEKENTRTLLASSREDGQYCVVKCYLRESPLYEHSEPQSLREIDTAPMPRFLAEYRSEKMRCVLREYVPGETLAQAAEAVSFSEADVIRIGLQLCDQLSALHAPQTPVIHRDIKPQNVILRPDGEAVLIDYGIARVQTENETGTDTVIFGTQGFAPPEQYGFSRTDARSDIYSLGVLLYWLVQRETKVPREGRTALEKVAVRCAAFDPDRRYGNIGQVRRALLAARPAAQRKRKTAFTLTACLLLVLAVLGIGLSVHAQRSSAVFSQPLIEQAVKASLDLAPDAPVRKSMLASVTGIYIVAENACPDADSFYSAVNRWYADGRSTRGPVTELSDLALMPNLENVCIAVQELSDISALSALPRLARVELKHNYITDISALAGMNHLTYVGINGNPVRDISPLVQCPNLAFLDLCEVRSYEPSVIAEVGNFDFLDISNPTESYRFLDGKSILDLRVAWTGLDDLHCLDQVTRLERLEIDHTDVADLSPLAAHKGLKVLKLGAIPAKDLSVLLELPQLEEVYVSRDMEPAVEALGEVPFAVIFE